MCAAEVGNVSLYHVDGLGVWRVFLGDGLIVRLKLRG
jgi:hypothetical protein